MVLIYVCVFQSDNLSKPKYKLLQKRKMMRKFSPKTCLLNDRILKTAKSKKDFNKRNIIKKHKQIR